MLSYNRRNLKKDHDVKKQTDIPCSTFHNKSMFTTTGNDMTELLSTILAILATIASSLYMFVLVCNISMRKRNHTNMNEGTR